MGPSHEVIEIPWRDSILDTIRERPAMYLGVKSLTALWFFLHGFEMARSRFEKESAPELPRHFSDWVAYRLHLESDWSGFWRHAILARVRNEEDAFDRFYELRDEFPKRESKLVATIRSDQLEYKAGLLDPHGNSVRETKTLPKSLEIVVYTGDPGFFLRCDAQEPFFFDDGRFFPALSAWGQYSAGRFDIRDETIWRRLGLEDSRWKKNLARRRKRIQQKAKMT